MTTQESEQDKSKPHEIIKVDNFAVNEATDAKEYWSLIDVAKHSTYLKSQSWSVELADIFAKYSPRSIFEFGCNAGKNLLATRDRLPDVFLSGVDINSQAINIARSRGLRAVVGDETVLELFPDRSFDICFTVSVLDHIPDPAPVLRELGRVSSMAIYFLEPWLGSEGRVVRNYNLHLDREIETTPYSYSWDIPALVKDMMPGWQLSQRPMPLPTNLGLTPALGTKDETHAGR